MTRKTATNSGTDTQATAEKRFGRKIALSRMALLWERAWPPVAGILALLGIFAALGLAEVWRVLPVGVHVFGLGFFALGVAWGLVTLARIKWPTSDEGRARYDELTASLARPENAGDPAQLARFGREIARLEPLVKLRDAILATRARVHEARELFDSPDAELATLAREELPIAEAEQVELEAAIRAALEPADPDADRNAILEIRAGTGGEEAALFAGELMRMYARFAERHGLKVETMSASE
ncbi:MAG: DUF4175 family protein, partial [Hyphomicrobiales bacterium]